jgi:hypothetical protein
MEPPRESRPSHDPVELYSQACSPEVWLQNHAVTVLAHIHLESTKGAYKFEGKLQDWIDNQQLMYLADPALTFVTADRKLIAKLGKSLDRDRVREFEEFVKAL